MGEERESIQGVGDEASPGAAPALRADPARDITVPAADPFASTLTVAVGPAPAGPRLEPGRELGPVRLVREIGRGATGTVFQGRHTVLGRDVAVKFLVNVSAGPGDAEGLRRFVDEARAAASVRHPNLTQVFHADLDGATPYLVLEYVQGPTLRQVLDHAGELTVPVAAAVLSDVAAAVAELHARGIIHRDIKPSNVLVDKDGRVYVTDFGLALRRSHAAGHGSAAADLEFAGTPAYMAGEMFEGRVSSRSDVYAMGVTAFQLLTGSTPFAGGFHEIRDKHLREPLPVEALRGRGVKAEVVEVIERATNKQPMFRYKTAPDFARAFREAAGCGVPEMARARKRLCDVVMSRATGVPVAAAEGEGRTGEVRLPYRAGDADDDSGSSLYTETISRIATIKRERRRHPPGEGEGSSTHPPALPVTGPASAGGRYDVLPVSVAPPPRPFDVGNVPVPPVSAPAVGPAPDDATDRTRPARPPVPGAVLSLGILGILYGTLAAVWQVGVLLGATQTRKWLPPVSEDTVRVYLFLVPAAILHTLLAAMFVPAAIGCLRLKSWGRRMLVAVSAADLVLQGVVLVAALAWVGPVTAKFLTSGAGTDPVSPVERAGTEAAVMPHWLFQWLALSLFPASALVVMTRRRTREDFDAAAVAAAAAPVDGGEEPDPFF